MVTGFLNSYSLATKEAADKTIRLAVEYGVLSAKQGELASSIMAARFAEDAATTSTNGLSLAFKGLWATISAHPLASLVVAIGAITIAAAQYHKKMQGAREELISQGKTAKSEADTLQKLSLEYKEANASLDGSAESKKRLDDATESLLESLGLERAEVEKLGKSYDDLGKKMDIATVAAIREKNRSLIDAQIAAEDHFSHRFSVLAFVNRENGKTA